MIAPAWNGARVAQRVLELAGYTVLTATNGGEALALLERHDEPVHLILTTSSCRE